MATSKKNRASGETIPGDVYEALERRARRRSGSAAARKARVTARVRISDLAAFVSRANDLGAVVDEHEAYQVPERPETAAYGAWALAPSGGCGEPGCRCSPGLWVSAHQGRMVAIAHFGLDWERGGEGVFGDAEVDAWRTLRDETGATR